MLDFTTFKHRHLQQVIATVRLDLGCYIGLIYKYHWLSQRQSFDVLPQAKSGMDDRRYSRSVRIRSYLYCIWFSVHAVYVQLYIVQ
jgi:hypothetical protein